jgi:CHC2-type zinc finger protein
MSADRLLSALERVRAKGESKWVALCPVHAEKTPSLSIDLLPDGTVLAHCFGCGANGQQVAEALGIPVCDLFPARPYDTPSGPGGRAPLHRHRHVQNILTAAAHEATVLVVAMEAQRQGQELSREDEDRVFLALHRLRESAS